MTTLARGRGRGLGRLSLLRVAPTIATLTIIAVSLIHHLPRLLAFWGAMLRWPYAMQGSESLIVWEAQRLAAGESIYVANGPEQHGFVSGPYTPLYFAAVAATLKLTPTVYTGGRFCWYCWGRSSLVWRGSGLGLWG
jgi:hypothetical protein